MRNSLRFAILVSTTLAAAGCGKPSAPAESKTCSDARASLNGAHDDLITSGNILFSIKEDGPVRDAASNKHRAARSAEAAALEAIQKHCPK